MNKKEVILLSVIILLLGTFTFVFIKNNNKNKAFEFYAKVTESFAKSSLIEPLHNEKIYQDYPVLQIDLGGLKEGDIIKVKANKNVLESYPPVVQVTDYEYIINNDIAYGEESEELNVTNAMITTTKKEEEVYENNKSVTTTTTTKKVEVPVITTTTTTKIQTTTSSSKDSIVLLELNNNANYLAKNQDDKTIGEKAKEYFINAVDFIFYGKDIKGVYFDELSTKAKLKAISITLKIDDFIDKYVPNYKEKIFDTYSNVKAKLVELYLDKTSEYCAKEGNEKVCIEAKNDFEMLKKSYNISWEFIKNMGSKGISKLKQWYEVYSGK